MAEYLRLLDALRPIRERERRVVPRLWAQARKIDRLARDPRRCPRLEASHPQAQGSQVLGQRRCRRLSLASPMGLPVSGVHQPAQKRPRGEDAGGCVDNLTAGEPDARKDPPLDDDRVDLTLANV